jgi:segregation and condensation protein A
MTPKHLRPDQRPDDPDLPPPGIAERAGSSTEYQVSLATFEGPLDLLLHLIQKHELDILDIPVSFITDKYLEYLSLMTDLHIDVASEYLVMAATLAHIKSKMLLPTVPTDQDDEILGEEGDPREELIRRLLEYQKYKNAAERLNERGALGRDVFVRGAEAAAVDEGLAPLAATSVFNLLDAFAKVLERAKVNIDHEVSFDRLSISERIQQLCDRFAGRSSCLFDELFDGQRTRFDLVITFLALLEMTRLKMTRIYQADAEGEIHIELAVTETAAATEIAPAAAGDEVYEPAAGPCDPAPPEAEEVPGPNTEERE